MEKEQNKIRGIINIFAYSLLLLMMSCKASFEPIDYGKDACTHCKMTIMDKRFAAEMITAKGRVFKFDDVHCMKLFQQENNADAAKAKFYVAAYNESSNSFLDAAKASFLQGDMFKSPMNGNCAAFATELEAKRYSDSLQININSKNWKDLK